MLITCPHCGHRDEVPDKLVGKRVQCQPCGGALTVLRPLDGDAPIHRRIDTGALSMPPSGTDHPSNIPQLLILLLPISAFASVSLTQPHHPDAAIRALVASVVLGTLIAIVGAARQLVEVFRHDAKWGAALVLLLPIPPLHFAASTVALTKYWPQVRDHYGRYLTGSLMAYAALSAAWYLGVLPLDSTAIVAALGL